MDDYQDQAVWFDLYGYDGFMWEFVADFDSLAEAVAFGETSEVMAPYEDYRPRRRRGLM